MLEALKREAGEGENVTVVYPDLSTPTWLDVVGDDQLFDIVVSGFAIHHQPDVRKKCITGMGCEWLRQIGFEDVDCFFKVFELALFVGKKKGEKLYTNNVEIARLRGASYFSLGSSIIFIFEWMLPKYSF